MRRLAGLLLAASAAGAAHAEKAPICTDRPAKANAVCTVPAGKVQVETTGVDWSVTEAHGTRTQLLTVAASVVKLGLSDHSDLQVGFTPYAELTERGASDRRFSGIGDLVLRYKHRLTGADARVQLALVPFLKLPTAARALGNGKLEGGLAAPISFTPVGQVTITFGPEIDLLADGGGRGRHIAVVDLVNASAPIAPRLTGSAEFWTSVSFDARGTVKQASADAALAYAVSTTVQLDIGTNLGLTRATSGVEAYAGISVRF